MANNSSIDWTDTTWNPLAGCREVSPGCTHCYAATMAHRLGAMAQADIAAGKNPGKKRHYIGTTEKRGGKVVWNGKVNLIHEALSEPFKWKKPRRVFVNSMSDLFHVDVPFFFIDRVFAVMALNSQHTFQVLTKRPDRAAEYFRQLQQVADDHSPPKRMNGFFTPTNVLNIRWVHANRLGGPASGWHPGSNPIPSCTPWPLPNVHLGTSTEDQARAVLRIHYLKQCPAVVRFISAEPLLGELNLDLDEIHWVITGCESGPGRRRTEQAWVESIAEQCHSAGVSFFNKQMEVDGRVTTDITEFPEHLQVREFPQSTSCAT